ncbi:MAG: fibronectin type III domain-containing protein, partial [Salinispira sp.]
MLTAPPTMYAPTLVAGSEQLTTSWVDPATWNWSFNNADNDIAEYHLRYREDSSGKWTEINSGITGASHVITELTNGLSYAVQVRAVNAQGTGGWSASSTATPTAFLAM